MNDIMTCCVESRRNALLGAVNPNDKDMLGVVDGFTEKLKEFASTCTDVTDFETKFATSNLATEYADLYTRAMNYGTVEEKEPTVGEEIRDEFVDDVNHAVRRKARQEAYDQVRDIPGVGKVVEAKQMFDLFGRFRKKKDD